MGTIIATLFIFLFSLMMANALKGQMAGIPLLLGSVLTSSALCFVAGSIAINSYSSTLQAQGQTIRIGFVENFASAIAFGTLLATVVRFLHFLKERGRSSDG